MPSFSKMGSFPVGYFRATTQWLLKERRDVVARIAYLQAELTRIGFVKMYYQAVPQGEVIQRTERRFGFSVTRNSSLARLVQAYIATGGNPYNISGFLHPDQTEWLENVDEDLVKLEQYPGGGIVAPKSVAYNNPVPGVGTNLDGTPLVDRTGYEGYEGGYVDSHRYYPNRQGGRLDRGAWDYSTVNRVMHDVRKWANVTIKRRLQDMEWQIIKLSDLHEQLRQERDQVLMEAFAGQLDGLEILDEEQYDPRRLVQSIIADMYALIYETDESGVPRGTKASADLGFLYFAFPNVPEENLGPMG